MPCRKRARLETPRTGCCRPACRPSGRPCTQAFGKAHHRWNQQRQSDEDGRRRSCAPAQCRLEGPALNGKSHREDREKNRGGDGGRQVPADDFVQGEDSDEEIAAQRLALEETQRQPRQCALVAGEVQPARRRGDGDHAVDKAKSEERQPGIADCDQPLAPQIIGEADESRRGEHELHERTNIHDRQVHRRHGQQGDEES